jgi:hypothetical protein
VRGAIPAVLARPAGHHSIFVLAGRLSLARRPNRRFICPILPPAAAIRSRPRRCPLGAAAHQARSPWPPGTLRSQRRRIWRAREPGFANLTAVMFLKRFRLAGIGRRAADLDGRRPAH